MEPAVIRTEQTLRAHSQFLAKPRGCRPRIAKMTSQLIALELIQIHQPASPSTEA